MNVKQVLNTAKAYWGKPKESLKLWFYAILFISVFGYLFGTVIESLLAFLIWLSIGFYLKQLELKQN